MMVIMQMFPVKGYMERPSRYAKYNSELLTHLIIPEVQA